MTSVAFSPCDLKQQDLLPQTATGEKNGGVRTPRANAPATVKDSRISYPSTYYHTPSSSPRSLHEVGPASFASSSLSHSLQQPVKTSFVFPISSSHLPEKLPHSFQVSHPGMMYFAPKDLQQHHEDENLKQRRKNQENNREGEEDDDDDVDAAEKEIGGVVRDLVKGEKNTGEKGDGGGGGVPRVYDLLQHQTSSCSSSSSSSSLVLEENVLGSPRGGKYFFNHPFDPYHNCFHQGASFSPSSSREQQSYLLQISSLPITSSIVSPTSPSNQYQYSPQGQQQPSACPYLGLEHLSFSLGHHHHHHSHNITDYHQPHSSSSSSSLPSSPQNPPEGVCKLSPRESYQQQLAREHSSFISQVSEGRRKEKSSDDEEQEGGERRAVLTGASVHPQHHQEEEESRQKQRGDETMVKARSENEDVVNPKKEDLLFLHDKNLPSLHHHHHHLQDGHASKEVIDKEGVAGDDQQLRLHEGEKTCGQPHPPSSSSSCSDTKKSHHHPHRHRKVEDPQALHHAAVIACVNRLIQCFPSGTELHNGYGPLSIPAYWLASYAPTSSDIRRYANAVESLLSSSSLSSSSSSSLRNDGDSSSSFQNQKSSSSVVPYIVVEEKLREWVELGGSLGIHLSLSSSSSGVGQDHHHHHPTSEDSGSSQHPHLSPTIATTPALFDLHLTGKPLASSPSTFYVVQDVVGKGAHGAVFRCKRYRRSSSNTTATAANRLSSSSKTSSSSPSKEDPSQKIQKGQSKKEEEQKHEESSTGEKPSSSSSSSTSSTAPSTAASFFTRPFSRRVPPSSASSSSGKQQQQQQNFQGASSSQLPSSSSSTQPPQSSHEPPPLEKASSSTSQGGKDRGGLLTDEKEGSSNKEKTEDDEDEEEDEYEEDQVALKIIDLDAALQLQESGSQHHHGGGGGADKPPHLMNSSKQARWKYLNQVMKEVQFLEKCQHENIVKMYETFQWPPCYLVLSMELLPGGSLRDLYASAGPLPEPIIANLMQ